MYHAYPNRNKGMSLVEVMVGMVIGLIGIVVIMQVYLANENFKRATTGAGSAQINGSIALYSLERDILSAGYNIADSHTLGCGILKWYYRPIGYAPTPIRVAPVVITVAGGLPDTIQVMYGSHDTRAVPSILQLAMASTGANLRLDNVSGYSPVPPATTPTDLILVTQGTDCTMMQVTNVLTGAAELVHTGSSALPWNPTGGGTFTAYAAGAYVFNLGKPTVNFYSINTGQLQQLRIFNWTASNAIPTYNSTPTILVDNIVDMKAQYGKDTTGDGIIDTWNKTLPASAAEWQQVLAIRVGVVARSQNYEKKNTSGTCTATNNAPGAADPTNSYPQWSGSYVTGSTPSNPTASPFIVTGGTDWNCYTYRVFETIMPLRNMLWRRT